MATAKKKVPEKVAELSGVRKLWQEVDKAIKDSPGGGHKLACVYQAEIGSEKAYYFSALVSPGDLALFSNVLSMMSVSMDAGSDGEE